MEGRLSLLFASFASLAVITEQTYALITGQAMSASYTQVGVLGLMFFTVALLAHVLYRRVRLTEELAARRKVDIDDLSKLNEFIIQDMAIAIGRVVIDGERKVKLMNQAARDMVNIPEPAPETSLKEVCADLEDWLLDHIRPTAPQMEVIRIGNRELKPARQHLGYFRAAGVMLYLRDNQGLIKEAQQIKPASLGTLTASIAHNIRNPLSAISHAGHTPASSWGRPRACRPTTAICSTSSAAIAVASTKSCAVSCNCPGAISWTPSLPSWSRVAGGVLRRIPRVPRSAFRPLAARVRAPANLRGVDPRHLY